MIASLGMYWFSRELGLGRAGAALAAICFAFGGWMVKVWEFASALGAVSWTPLFLALVQRGVKGSYRSLLLMGALILALQVFAGYPLIVLFTVCAGAWLILANLMARRGLRRNSLIALASFAAACLLAVPLSAVQLIPTAELASLSPRVWAHPYMLSAEMFSLHPAELADLLVPYLCGFPDWQKCFYIGILPAVLAFFALFSFRWLQRGRRELLAAIVFCLGLISVGVALALGKYTPIYPFVCRTIKPLAGLLTWPSWYMLLAYLSFAILAGLGFQLFLESGKPTKAVTLHVIIGAFFLAALILSVKPDIIGYLRPPSSIEPVGRNPRIDPWRFPPSMVALEFLINSVLSGSALLILRLPGIRSAYRIGVPLAISVLDLWVFSSKQVFFSYRNMYVEQPKIVSALTGDKESFRLTRAPIAGVLNTRLYGSRSEDDFAAGAELVRAEMGLLYGIFRTYERAALSTAEPIGFQKLIDSPGIDDKARLNLLNLVNVRYILLFKTGPQGMSTTLNVNDSALPRAFFVPSVKRLGTQEDVLKAMASPDFDPREHILISQPIRDANPEPAPTGSPTLVSTPAYTANTVRLRCVTNSEGFLFISDAYYPGWTVYINGRETEVLKADCAFRAARVPAGESAVLFRYEPPWFLPAAVISAASWLVLLSLIALTRLRRRAPPPSNARPFPL